MYRRGEPYLFLYDFLNVLDGSHFSVPGGRAHIFLGAQCYSLV